MLVQRIIALSFLGLIIWFFVWVFKSAAKDRSKAIADFNLQVAEFAAEARIILAKANISLYEVSEPSKILGDAPIDYFKVNITPKTSRMFRKDRIGLFSFKAYVYGVADALQTQEQRDDLEEQKKSLDK
jgi:hypothetical protein